MSLSVQMALEWKKRDGNSKLLPLTHSIRQYSIYSFVFISFFNSNDDHHYVPICRDVQRYIHLCYFVESERLTLQMSPFSRNMFGMCRPCANMCFDMYTPSNLLNSQFKNDSAVRKHSNERRHELIEQQITFRNADKYMKWLMEE